MSLKKLPQWHKMPYDTKVWFTWSPHPKSTHVSKFPNEGKISTFEPQETIRIRLIIIEVGSWLFYAQNILGTCIESSSSFLLNPTLNTSPKPHLQKVLPCRHPCHTWDLGLGILWKAVKSQLSFNVLNGWDCTDWPQVTWDLGPCVNWL